MGSCCDGCIGTTLRRLWWAYRRRRTWVDAYWAWKWCQSTTWPRRRTCSSCKWFRRSTRNWSTGTERWVSLYYLARSSLVAPSCQALYDGGTPLATVQLAPGRTTGTTSPATTGINRGNSQPVGQLRVRLPPALQIVSFGTVTRSNRKDLSWNW